MAPEVFMKVPYDQAADMWSIGAIMFILLGGYHPFVQREMDPQSMMKAVLRNKVQFHGECWSEISDDAKDLIFSLLIVNPDRRADVTDALECDWMYADFENLDGVHLRRTIDNLVEFNARRKFRSAAGAVRWIVSSKAWKS